MTHMNNNLKHLHCNAFSSSGNAMKYYVFTSAFAFFLQIHKLTFFENSFFEFKIIIIIYFIRNKFFQKK